MQNFWDYHGLIFIFFMFFFPRLTMLFATTVGVGFFYWIGWLLFPRLTVAIIGTYLFRDNNMILLMFTWIWVLVGEFSEKVSILKRT